MFVFGAVLVVVGQGWGTELLKLYARPERKKGNLRMGSEKKITRKKTSFSFRY